MDNHSPATIRQSSTIRPSYRKANSQPTSRNNRSIRPQLHRHKHHADNGDRLAISTEQTVVARKIIKKKSKQKKSNKKKYNKNKFSHLNRRDDHSEKEKIEEYIREKRSNEIVETAPDANREWDKYLSWKQRKYGSCPNTNVLSLRTFLLDGLHTEFPHIDSVNDNILQYYGLRNAIQAVIQFDKKSDICPILELDYMPVLYRTELYDLINMAYEIAKAYENKDKDYANVCDKADKEMMVKMLIIQALSTKHQLMSDVYIQQMLKWHIKMLKRINTYLLGSKKN